MSKFFKGGGSSSSETESSESDDEFIRAQPKAATLGKQREIRMLSESDEDEDKPRIVRSAKDKRYAELKDLIRQLRNAKKIKDMNKTLQIFEELCRSYTKAKPVMEREGTALPRFYIRYLSELDNFVNAAWADAEGRRKMNKPNAKGLANLRQKLKKYLPELETELEAYRESPDPDGYSSAEEEAAAEEIGGLESDSESEEDEALRRPPKAAGSDEESPGWSDSSDSSDSELSDLEGKKMEDLRKMFLKKVDTGRSAEDKEKRKAEKRRRQEEKERERERLDADDDWKTVSGGKAVEKPKMFEKDADINHEAVLKKLAEILVVRGKKGSDRREMVQLLKELKSISEANNLGKAMSAKILFNIIRGMYEYNPKLSECMRVEVWQGAMERLNELLGILNEHPEVIAHPTIPEDAENLDKPADDGKYYVSGCLLTLLERLDDEFIKILQVADCHSTDYVDKLKGEKGMCELLNQVESYMESHTEVFDQQRLCRIYIKSIEHLYYKLERTGNGEASMAAMGKRCHFVYAHDSERRLRERAMLMHIYHQALHDRWQEARDLLLMSHLQLTIDHSDIPNQILYNRALCQLGLCAFRDGKMGQAHAALSDIQNSGRSKELLAQGLSMRPAQDRTTEQEKLERQRQVPYHMHINLELLECVYLICSMLLEIPQMAGRDHEMRRKLLSRSFHYQLKQSERSSLCGPPENTREHVVAASKALLAGDWAAARDFLINEKMNAKVWNLFSKADHVREMVTKRIQEVGLRTYLLTHASIYSTVSLNVLATMFSLTPKNVHSIISKMIIMEELTGSLDEPAECLVIHRVEPTRLQLLSLQLTDRLAHMAENNDQLLDPKPASQPYAGRSQGGQGGGQGGWYQGNRGGRDWQGGNRPPRSSAPRNDYGNRRHNYGNRY